MEMIRSGIAALDEQLGGLVAGRVHVVTGAPGTGKTVACLEFLKVGILAGERSVLLTHADPRDLVAQGEFLGLDLERAVQEGRLLMLRYQRGFAREVARAVSPDVAFRELRALLGDSHPTRVVIDSVSPVLEGGGTEPMRGVVSWLAATGAASLVTVPGDFATLYDWRLEPLVQPAAAILHFALRPDGTRRLEIRKLCYHVRSSFPIAFCIEPGLGIVGIPEGPGRRIEELDDRQRQRVLLDSVRTLPARSA